MVKTLDPHVQIQPIYINPARVSDIGPDTRIVTFFPKSKVFAETIFASRPRRKDVFGVATPDYVALTAPIGLAPAGDEIRLSSLGVWEDKDLQGQVYSVIVNRESILAYEKWLGENREHHFAVLLRKRYPRYFRGVS